MTAIIMKMQIKKKKYNQNQSMATMATTTTTKIHIMPCMIFFRGFVIFCYN